MCWNSNIDSGAGSQSAKVKEEGDSQKGNGVRCSLTGEQRKSFRLFWE